MGQEVDKVEWTVAKPTDVYQFDLKSSAGDYRGLRSYWNATCCENAAEIRLIRHDSGLTIPCRWRQFRGLRAFGVHYAGWGIDFGPSVVAPERVHSALASLCRQRVRRLWPGLVVRIPPVQHAEFPWLESVACAAGFTRVSKPQHFTSLVDLQRDESEILAGLHGKFRNQIRSAERRGVQVEIDDRVDDPDFCRQLQSLSSVKGFKPSQSPEFFQAANDGGHFRLFRAVCDGGLLGAVMIGLAGEVGTYLLGSRGESSDSGSAANLLQWNVMRWLKERSARIYDLGGVDWNANPGVYRFKSRMGGRLVPSGSLLFCGGVSRFAGLLGTGHRILGR